MIDRQTTVTAEKPDTAKVVSELPADKTAAWLAAVIGSAMDGVVVVDEAYRIVLMNGEAEKMFRCGTAQLAGKPFETLLSPWARTEHRLQLEQQFAGRGPDQPHAHDPVFLAGRRADGEEFPVSARMSRVPMQNGNYLFVSLRETAAPSTGETPVRIERRKRAVSSQQASEIEKRRVSKELYDDLGQRLSVLKLDMDWLERSLPADEKLSPARIAQMQGLLDNIIVRTKNIASSLRPPLLDDFGLLPAVTWMVDAFQKRTAIPCTVESNGVAGKPGDPTESAIFRVVQEGLLNIERHAHATHARIVIWRNGNRIDVMVEDNGIGMPAGSENKPGCYGLIAMQERIYTLGGTINFSNIAPQGVSIRASVPFDSSPLLQGNAP